VAETLQSIAESGQLDQGLAAYYAALDEFRRTNAGLRIPHHLRLLATLQGKAGNVISRLALIDQAIATADANSETWCNAELHRERGELLLLAAGPDAENQADAEFRIAIETAAAQEARLPELHASVARARLQASQGRRQHARDILAPIFAWFCEDWETRDLVEARTLLANLH
jgi:predicted ATPase